MKSNLFAVRETGRGGVHALRLYSSLVLVGGALVFSCSSCKDTTPSPKETSGFSAIPAQSAVPLPDTIILVSPPALDFGSVSMGQSVTDTFLVESIGPGKLVGTASVSAPFKIISGGNYALTDKEIQVVTIEYTPRRAQADTATVTFTGGGGAKATVSGKAAAARRN